MKSKLITSIILLLTGFFSLAQITTDPELPVASKKVTITFDSSKESKLGYYTGELYAHTGVTIEGEGRWKYVIESWGNNTTQPKLTHKGDGIYEFEISPDIHTFYNVPISEKITELCLVFRSADAGKQTNDLFVDIFSEGLVVNITQPQKNAVSKINDTLQISANSSDEASLRLFINDTQIAENSGTTIASEYVFTESGNFWLIAEATADSTVRDSVSIFVRDEVTQSSRPAAYKKGINYPTDNSAALVLWAPLKEYVFVLGDFNDWKPSNEFLMKKDGDYFWLDISNLEKGKEYIFQYWIDGEIKIADPYTEKIVDPRNDEYITDDVYPDLIAYPEGKTEGISSVLQPGQEEYNWHVTDFQVPDKNKIVIYELLIRDFTTEHTYQSVIDKLDYLEDLNINVLELMPVNEFEGNSSWGYNPSFYFAPDKYYGPKNKL
ncbi:MAG: alpha-amylase, partial [Draconibacterium sp.]|nr:alpha-amylase [Draconibacterium sp.]